MPTDESDSHLEMEEQLKIISQNIMMGSDEKQQQLQQQQQLDLLRAQLLPSSTTETIQQQLSSSADQRPPLDFLQFAQILRPPLRSPFSHVRLAAIRILLRLCSSDTSSNAKAFTGPLQILLEAEQCPADFDRHRLRAQIVRRLKHPSMHQMLVVSAEGNAAAGQAEAETGTEEEQQQQRLRRLLLDKLVLDWLLAQFYERLTLYWPLLTEPIESFAKAVPVDAFWECFGQALDQAWARVVRQREEKEEQESNKNDEDNEQKTREDEEQEASASLPPDYAAYRVQLLRLLSKLPAAANAEKRTRYLAPKFIQLYREEFMQFDELNAPNTSSESAQGAKVEEAEGNADEEEEELKEGDEEEDDEEEEILDTDEEDEVEEEAEEEEENEDEMELEKEEEILEEGDENDVIEDEESLLEGRQRKKKKVKGRRQQQQRALRPLTVSFHTRRPGTLNALKAMLTLFGRFTNPLGVYREPEIREIYYELLLVNEADVQRLALACLCSYKHSWLTPYRDSLEGMLEERSLRDHLVLFAIDAEQTRAMGSEKQGRSVGKKTSRAVPLLAEHRAQLMPILLRLLYGCLHTHVAQRGKSKRLAIFRFLANCLPEELALFLRILFGPLISLFETASDNQQQQKQQQQQPMVDVERTLTSLGDKRPIVQSISLNKLKSVLGTLGDVFRMLGPALEAAQLEQLFAALLLAGRVILLRDQWLLEEEGGTEGNNRGSRRGTAELSPQGRQLRNLRLLCVQTIVKFLRAFHSTPTLPVSCLHCLFVHFLAPLIAAKGQPFAGIGAQHQKQNAIENRNAIDKQNADAGEEEMETEPCLPSLLLALPASVCRLFCTWTKIPRYHPLLNVPFTIHLPDNKHVEHAVEHSTTTTTAFALLCDQLLLFGGEKQKKSATATTVVVASPVHVEILRVCSSLLDSSTNEGDNTELSSLEKLLPQAELQGTSAAVPTTNTANSFGARLVLADANVDTVLAHLSHIIRGGSPPAKSGSSGGGGISSSSIGRIPPVYFDMLSRLSSHVHRLDLGQLFAQTLLHYIANRRGLALRKQRPEKALTLMQTLANLSTHLEQPLQAIGSLGPLFSHLSGRQLRESLTRMVCSLRQNQRLPAGGHKLLELLDGLESWDPRRIAEPDADRRCEALLQLHDWYEQREAAKLVVMDADADEGGGGEFLKLFAHSHAHSIMKSTDLSLRGTAANCLRQLITFVAHPPVAQRRLDANRLLHSHLIPLVLRGLNCQGGGEKKDADESVRYEFLQCLVQLLRSFPNDAHLAPLRAIGGDGGRDQEEEKEEEHEGSIHDPDRDFFACAIHIQAHRRQRAFYRLAERLNSGELQIGHLPLLHFILPVVQPYLLLDTASSHRTALADQALALFSAILKRVPWPKYQNVLEGYLRLVDNNNNNNGNGNNGKDNNGEKEEKEQANSTKATIRVIIAILDAFHFDLRACQEPQQLSNKLFSTALSISSSSASSAAEKQKQQKQEQWLNKKANDKSNGTGTGRKPQKQQQKMKNTTENAPPHLDGEAEKRGEEHDAMAMAMDVDEEDEAPVEVENLRPAGILPEQTMRGRQRIYATVTGKLLPRLRELLNPQRQMHSHRRAQQFAARGFQHEEDKLVRAPLAIAAVKLFKWLPQWAVDRSLNNFLFPLNHLLMSRCTSVRQGARKLIVQMLRMLGPKQLAFVIRELKQTMNKGYQVHVMLFTVHTLISALEQQMQPGDIDPCLREIMEVCKWETFGNSQLQQEKERDRQQQPQLTESHGIPEAKASSNKTAETLTQIGRFVGSERALDDIVLGQMRGIVEASPRSETVSKLADWLRALSVGLRSNAGGVPPLRQLQFALQLAGTNLRQMLQDQERLGADVGRGKSGASAHRPPSCLLLPPEPKRLGVIHKISVKSKVHIFVEFALQLLADQLKARSVGGRKAMETLQRDWSEETKTEADEEEEDEAQLAPNSGALAANEQRELLALLEQFFPLLLHCMRQKYDKIIGLSLRSLLYMFKYPLKTLCDRHSELVDRLFAILADYAAMGHAGNKPAVLELQQHLFKCFTQVVRDAPLTMFNGNRLQLLLNYVETDILDTHKQATAFNLVKAIVGRRIEDEKVSNVIEYLSETAITSFSASIRGQSRQVLLLYLTVHPQGQRSYEHWMEFFLNQMEYELEDGRMSALEMVHAMLNQFTEEANARYALLVHMKLATRLVNESGHRCRQFVANCLRKLLASITASAFNDVHAATGDWLAARKPSIRLLAWRAFAQFVHSGSAHFTPAHQQLLAQRVCGELATKRGAEFATGGELSTQIKTALCELLRAIAERAPHLLMAQILAEKEEEEQQKKEESMAQQKGRRREGKGRRKKKVAAIDEEEESGKKKTEEDNDGENQQQRRFRQFFANLEDCLLACRHRYLASTNKNTANDNYFSPVPSVPNPLASSSSAAASPADRLQLSIAAAQFLHQWLADGASREALIQRLSSISRTAEESPISGQQLSHETVAVSPLQQQQQQHSQRQWQSQLQSLCLCLICLLNPESEAQRQKRRNRLRMKQKTVKKRQKPKSDDLGEEDEDNEEEKANDENDEEEEDEEIRMDEADGQDGARIAQIEPCATAEETVMDKEGEEEDSEQWDETLADLSIRLLTQLVPPLSAAAAAGDHFDFVCRKLAKVCWTEVAKEPSNARKRLAIFKLVGALATKCGGPESVQFSQLCTRFLPLLYREMNRKSHKFTDELHSLATEVSAKFKERMDGKEYSARLAQCQREWTEHKKQRTQATKAQLVTDPAAAITAKQKRHQRKRVAKMRRLDEQKPYRAYKRRRREEAIRRVHSPPPA